jgi:hypothetical protein
MFFAEGQIRVHLYGEPTDMRKSYDGLQALARHAMQRAPLDGALYVIDDDIRVRAHQAAAQDERVADQAGGECLRAGLGSHCGHAAVATPGSVPQAELIDRRTCHRYALKLVSVVTQVQSS